MRKIKYLVPFLCACAFLNHVSAQQDLTLYNMQRVPQRNYLNPALFPAAKINYAVPVLSSIYLNAYNNGFKYSDLIKKGADDSLHIDFDNMLSKLSNDNYLSTALYVDLLTVGLKVQKNYFTLVVTEKMNFRFRYPKDLMEFLQKGNGALLDRKIDFNFGLNSTHYREYAFGYARKINNKLAIGGKFKYLYGMENVSIEKSDISLTTGSDANFPITLQSDVLVNTAGVDSSSFADFNATNYAFKKKNKGLGLDLGATYNLNDRISLSASVLDLGFIKWKTEVNNYKSRVPGAAFTYNGVEFNNFLNDTSSSDPFAKLLDSLNTSFNVDSTHESYSTKLPAQIYIGGNYYINSRNNAGILFYGQFFDKKIHPALALSYNTGIGRWLVASATYSILNRSYNNIGLGIALNMVNVQLYMVSDNVLGAFFPQHTKNIHLHVGLNITMKRELSESHTTPVPAKKDAYSKRKNRQKSNKIASDKDQDNVPDADDECPDTAGLPALKGCPDRDGDGIKDSEDRCPDKAGPIENKGCPLAKLFMLGKSGEVIASASMDEEGKFVFESLPTVEVIMFRLEGDETDLMTSVNVVMNGNAKKAVKGKDGYFRFEQLGADDSKLKLLEEENVLIRLNQEEEEIVNKAADNLEFNPGKDIIKFDSYASLNELVDLLAKNPTWRIKLFGYTDNEGSNEGNALLSRKRTEAIKKFIVDRGIQEERVIVKYYDATQPAADNAAPEGKQKNRRVEMLIIE